MTNRSVQIWFQNRRAKEKKVGRGDLPTTSSPSTAGGTKAPMGSFAAQFTQLQPSFSPSQSTSAGGPLRMAPQSGMGGQGHGYQTASPSLSSASPATVYQSHSSPSLSPMMSHQPQYFGGSSYATPRPRAVFGLDRLKIGSWTRLTMAQGDLICKVDPAHQTMCWEIIEGQHRCKIEFAFGNISLLEKQVVNEQVTLLNVMLSQVPSFYLQVRLPDGKNAWKACNDITEDQQASHHSRHVVQVNTSLLDQNLVPLMTTDPVLSRVSSVKHQQQVFHTPVSVENEVPPERQAPPEDLEIEKTMKKSYVRPPPSLIFL